MTRVLARWFALTVVTLPLVSTACHSGGHAAGAKDGGTSGGGGTSEGAGAGAAGAAGAGGTAGVKVDAGAAGRDGGADGRGDTGRAEASGTAGMAGMAGAGGQAGSAGSSGGGGVAANWPGTRTFGSTVYQLATGIAVDANGSIYLGGETRGPLYGQPQGVMNDLFALKVSSGAAVQWATETDVNGEEWSAGVALDGSGNVYVAGSTYASMESGGFDAVLVKHDKTGARQWVRTFGSARYDYARGVATDAAGNIYLAGQAGDALEGNTSAGGNDGFLAKFDAAGTRLWIRQLGTTGDDNVSGVATDAAGNIYVTGHTDGAFDGTTNAGMKDVFLAKFDGAGTRQWTRLFGTLAPETAGAVTVDGAGNIYVVGTTSGDLAGTGNLGGNDAFIVKFDAAGARSWTRQFGAANSEGASGVATDAAGNIYIGGITGGIDPTVSVATGQYALYLAKYDSAGTLAWLRQTPQATSFSCAIAVDPRDGDVFLTGRCLNSFDGQPCGATDIFVMKFTPAGAKL